MRKLLLALTAICLCAASVAHAGSNGLEVRMKARTSSQLVLSADRVIMPNSSNTGTSYWNSRTLHTNRSGQTLNDMLVGVPNFFTNIFTANVGQDIGVGGVTTFQVLVEYPIGTCQRLTIGGNTSGTTPDISVGYTDDVTLTNPIPANAQFGIRIFGSNPSGITYANGSTNSSWRNSSLDNMQYTSTVQTETACGTIPTNNVSFGSFQPAMIASHINNVAVAIIGDSIMFGKGNVINNTTFISGALQPSLSTSFPSINLGSSSAQAALWPTNTPARQTLLKYESAVINSLGSNDINIAGHSAATLEANQATLLAGLPPNIKYVTLATIPYVAGSSTNGFTTVAGQTTHSAGIKTITDTYNTAVKASGITGQNNGFIDLNSAISDTSGVFSVASFARTDTQCGMASTSSNVVTSVGLNFTASDVGTSFYIAGAGTAGANLTAIIGSVTDATHANLVQFGSGTTTFGAPQNAITATGTSQACGTGGFTNDGTHPALYPDNVVIPASGIVNNSKFHNP